MKIIIEGRPCSENNRWVSTRTRKFFPSADYLKWKAKVIAAAHVAGCRPIQGNVKINFFYYHQHEKQHQDLTGPVKLTLDALKGIAYEDDKQIVEMHLYRSRDKDNPRVEIVIEEAA